VILVSRTKETLKRSLQELHEQNIDSYGVPADASDPESLKMAFGQIKSEYGVLHRQSWNSFTRTFFERIIVAIWNLCRTGVDPWLC
jgi:hypothetical protein